MAEGEQTHGVQSPGSGYGASQNLASIFEPEPADEQPREGQDAAGETDQGTEDGDADSAAEGEPEGEGEEESQDGETGEGEEDAEAGDDPGDLARQLAQSQRDYKKLQSSIDRRMQKMQSAFEDRLDRMMATMAGGGGARAQTQAAAAPEAFEPTEEDLNAAISDPKAFMNLVDRIAERRVQEKLKGFRSEIQPSLDVAAPMALRRAIEADLEGLDPAEMKAIVDEVIELGSEDPKGPHPRHLLAVLKKRAMKPAGRTATPAEPNPRKPADRRPEPARRAGLAGAAATAGAAVSREERTARPRSFGPEAY